VKLQAAGGLPSTAVVPVAAAAPVATAASAAPAAAVVAPAASTGAHVIDMLETIQRGGARMGRGITP
jgi:hypothetical protein